MHANPNKYIMCTSPPARTLWTTAKFNSIAKEGFKNRDSIEQVFICTCLQIVHSARPEPSQLVPDSKVIVGNANGEMVTTKSQLRS